VLLIMSQIRAWGVAMLVLSLQATAMTIERSDQDMEMEEVEFPYTALSDTNAGSPGSAVRIETDVEDAPGHTEAAAVACDMSGNTDDIAPGEDPVVIDSPENPAEDTTPWAGSSIEGFELKEFACKASTHRVETDPKATSSFNLYNAQFEGNNRGGLALASEFEVTPCGCICSGVNSACGKVGSVSYYSSVPSSDACAQMVCHKNQFRQCNWYGQAVARGEWAGDIIKFTTPVVDAAVVLSNKTISSNSTTSKNGTTPGGIMDSFHPTPVPTPEPTFEELVNARAMVMIARIADHVCVPVAHATIQAIAEDIKGLALSSDPTTVCTYEPSQLSSDDLANVESARQRSDYVDNALAGYSGASPLAADSTRHASQNMDSVPTMLLVDVSHTSQAIDVDAFQKTVLFLRNAVSESVQCAPGTPSMEDMVRDVLSINKTCGAQALLQYDEGTSQLVQEFVDKVVRETKKVLHVGVAVIQHPPAPVVPVTVATPPEEEEEGDDDDSAPAVGTAGQTTSDDMNPPLFPPLAPAPTDLSYDGPAMGMDAPEAPECDDIDGGSVSANAPQADDLRRTPGKREATTIEDLGKPELPLFGRQKLEWAPRDVDVVILNQPPQLEATS